MGRGFRVRSFMSELNKSFHDRTSLITLYNVCSVHRGMFSTSAGVQYIGGSHEYIVGISWVHRGVFSTSGDIMMHVGGYHEYIGGCSVHWRDTMSTLGGISWVHRGDIMMHVGEQVGKNLSISIENPNVLNIRISPDVLMISPTMYSWYPPDVLNISRCAHGIPHMHHDIPPMYWTSPDVLMMSPDVLMISPDVLMISLLCTEHPPMYSWYPPDVLNTPRCTHGVPPMYSWCPPDVLMVSPRCTEHPPMYWTHVIQGVNTYILKTGLNDQCFYWPSW